MKKRSGWSRRSVWRSRPDLTSSRMHAALSSCVTSLWMVAVASRKSDSHLSSEWSVARAVESDRAVESGLVVESGRAVEPSLERKLVARRWPARSERIPRMLWVAPFDNPR